MPMLPSEHVSGGDAVLYPNVCRHRLAVAEQPATLTPAGSQLVEEWSRILRPATASNSCTIVLQCCITSTNVSRVSMSRRVPARSTLLASFSRADIMLDGLHHACTLMRHEHTVAPPRQRLQLRYTLRYSGACPHGHVTSSSGVLLHAASSTLAPLAHQRISALSAIRHLQRHDGCSLLQMLIVIAKSQSVKLSKCLHS